MNEAINVIDAIRKRRSIRKFKLGASVTDDQIKLLLEAAMMAPSACNTRPWEFIVVNDREKLDELAASHPYAKMLETASFSIIVCALPDVQKEIASGYFPQDCAAATQNILIQAAALGLGSCWCGVYPKEERIAEVRTVLGIARQDIIPFNIIAIGVPDVSPDSKGFYEENKVRYI